MRVILLPAVADVLSIVLLLLENVPTYVPIVLLDTEV